MWVNIPVPWILWGNEKSSGRKQVYIAPNTSHGNDTHTPNDNLVGDQRDYQLPRKMCLVKEMKASILGDQIYLEKTAQNALIS